MFWWMTISWWKVSGCGGCGWDSETIDGQSVLNETVTMLKNEVVILVVIVIKCELEQKCK